MKILRQTAPYIRNKNIRVERMMRDVIIALIPVVLFAVYSFGFKAVGILAVATVTMVLTELGFEYITKKEINVTNRSAIISGLIFGLIMPDTSPLWVVAISAFAGMTLAKVVFGGLGNNIFNVAGFARIFAVLGYGGHLAYSKHAIDGQTGATSLSQVGDTLITKGMEDLKILDLFTGSGIPGSIGEVSVIAILIGATYLLVRKSADWRLMASFIGMFAAMALAVGIFNFGITNSNVSGIEFALVHIFSGGLMFGAVFMITDPVTSPITGPGRVIYAGLAGAITFFIRIFGGYPEGVVFAIVIMNMFVPAIDYYKWSTSTFTKRKILGISLAALILVVVAIMGTYIFK